ncbi:hypothetical protein C8T65DRAFT_667437 [Cerioporus squamosus]|nr:hypothetical protein C8T65DRAFT_667437 [Cerioporus squamosus]
MPSRTFTRNRPADRNVVLGDYHGHVLAGFHQYGTISWTTFFQWLHLLLDTPNDWIVVRGDRFDAEQYFPCDDIVMPGNYILLAADGSPIHINLTHKHARRRQPTPTRHQERDHKLSRFVERDGKCMVYGHSPLWSGLQPSHIFSRAHMNEWTAGGYASLITDTACISSMGGDSKIGSIQNMLLLSADLHRPWADHEFGVDPDNEYRITAFVAGHENIVDRVLRVDHISDPTKRPLDQLLRDHFLQGLLKHVKGAGEQRWDYEHTFGTGAFDLSENAVWGTEEGKERLELELENRLFEHKALQESPAIPDSSSRSML